MARNELREAVHALRRVLGISILTGGLVLTGSGRATVINRQQAIEDLDFLAEQLKAKHPKPFGQISEEHFYREVRQLKAGLHERVEVKDLSLSIAALLALVRDNHTNHRNFVPFYEHTRSGGKVFPVKLRYRDGQMTVEACSPDIRPGRIRPGDAVMAVNGQAMESLLERYGRYISAETDLQRGWALEGLFEKYQVLLGDRNDPYTLKLSDSDGQIYQETLPAVSPWLERYEQSKWAWPRFHHEFCHDGKVCLFKARSFSNNLRDELEQKLLSLIDEMRKKETEILIVDLRGNGGGDAALGTGLLRTVIRRKYDWLRPNPRCSWPVRLALICDRGTDSAASWLAALVMDHGMGIVAGEETGGRASFFGNITHARLPHSGLTCGIATKFFMRPAGYDDRKGVLPDLPLDVTVEDHVLVESIHAHIRILEGYINTEAPDPAVFLVKTTGQP